MDSTDLDAVRDAMHENTRIVYVETPTNPMMEVTDIAGAARIAHEKGALLAVDNTFLSPYFQRPLALGPTWSSIPPPSFSTATAIPWGACLFPRVPRTPSGSRLFQKSAGGILSPFDSFLVLRGLKTLVVRMERHETSGRAVADFLDGHPKVERVLYPGLSSHPGHELQKAQASGFGALITFDLGSYDNAKGFLDNLEVMSLAESLGGVETLISHPASMTHASVPPEDRERLGMTAGVVRVSVGLEDLQDLIGDLSTALDAA